MKRSKTIPHKYRYEYRSRNPYDHVKRLLNNDCEFAYVLF